MSSDDVEPNMNEAKRLTGNSRYRDWIRQDYHTAAKRTRGAADQMMEMEPMIRTSVYRRPSFIQEFAHSKGAPIILMLSMLLALALGSTIGVVPAVMSDRYARLNHGYTNATDCSEIRDATTKPAACLAGSADAQNAVALEQFVSNGISFFSSPLLGSLSDEYGRRGFLILGISLCCLSPLALVLVQLDPTMSPSWYYAAGACTGLVNWIAIALSALADVMPATWRAPTFGLLLAGFSLGFAAAPQFALWLGHLRVSALSLCLLLVGLCLVVCFFPETLSPAAAAAAKATRQEQVERVPPGRQRWLWYFSRPVRALSIINKNHILRLLSCLAFFSGLVTAGDRTLLIYYAEERLGFNDKDVATMFAIVGLLGIFCQGVVLKLLNDAIGERRLVTLCFVIGSLHNVMYGLARKKSTLLLAFSFSALVAMNFPIISAIKSNQVEKSEQGQIQGALYSLSAVASACGPAILRTVYHFTKNGAFLGPGSMFVVAAMIDLIAVGCAYSLPENVNSRKDGDNSTEDIGSMDFSISSSSSETSNLTTTESGGSSEEYEPII